MVEIQQPSAKQKTAAAIAAACLVAGPVTASFEGLRTHPYHDPAPKHTLTVCYGQTHVKMKVYTPEECRMMLEADQKREYAPAVLHCTPQVAGKINIFASAIDAAWNAGPGNYCKSPIATSFKKLQWGAGCNAYRGWHTLPGTAAHNGLVRRRETERTLCLKDAA